jgi:hypothetical protein
MMKTLLTARFALCLLGCLAGLTASAQEPLRGQFERRFAVWQNWVAAQPERALLTIGEAYRDLVELGPRAAPFFAEQMLAAEEPRKAAAMAEALARVTDKRFPRAEWPEGKYLDPVLRVQLYSEWWQEGRQRTAADFARLYTRWKELKAHGDLVFLRDVYVITYDDEQKAVVTKRTQQRSELAEVYDAMKNMGVDILPLIIEQFIDKDYDLLPIFRELTHIVPRGQNLDERIAYCVKWWEGNKGDWVIGGK